MASGGIQELLTPEENTEYGGWKRLGMALGHVADAVSANEREGYFIVGLLATCPSMPGLVAGLQRSGPTAAPIRIGMLWLDASAIQQLTVDCAAGRRGASL